MGHLTMMDQGIKSISLLLLLQACGALISRLIKNNLFSKRIYWISASLFYSFIPLFFLNNKNFSNTLTIFTFILYFFLSSNLSLYVLNKLGSISNPDEYILPKKITLVSTTSYLLGTAIGPYIGLEKNSETIVAISMLSSFVGFLLLIAALNSETNVKEQLTDRSSYKNIHSDSFFYIFINFLLWVTFGALQVIEIPILKERFNFDSHTISLLFSLALISNIIFSSFFHKFFGKEFILNSKHLALILLITILTVIFYGVNTFKFFNWPIMITIGVLNGLYLICLNGLVFRIRIESQRLVLFQNLKVAEYFGTICGCLLAALFSKLDGSILILSIGIIVITFFLIFLFLHFRKIAFFVLPIITIISYTKHSYANPIRHDFNVVIPSLPKSCLPTEAGLTPSALVFNQIFNRLYEYTEQDLVEPVLIAKHVWSQNGTHLNLTLKKGIFFSDGTELTSKDVYYSITNSLKLLKGGAGWAFGNINGYDQFKKSLNLSHLSGFKVIDKYNISFTFMVPDKAFISILGSSMFIISKNGNSCIGTGTFKLEQLEATKITLSLSPHNNFNSDPIINRLTFYKIMPKNTEIDLVLGGAEFPTYLLKIPSKQTRLIVGIFNTKKTVFKSSENRCLIAENLQKIFKHNEFKFTDIDKGLPLAWNLTKLAEIPEHKTNKLIPSFNLTISDSSFTFNPSSVKLISNQFKQKNINAIVRLLPIEKNVELATSGNFDVTIMGYVPDYFHPDALLSSFVGTDQFYNLSKYSNHELDNHLLQGRTSGTIEEQTDAYKKSFKILTNDCPIVFLGVPQNHAYINKSWILPNYSTLGYQFIKLDKLRRSE